MRWQFEETFRTESEFGPRVESLFSRLGANLSLDGGSLTAKRCTRTCARRVGRREGRMIDRKADRGTDRGRSLVREVVSRLEPIGDWEEYLKESPSTRLT